jgi:hypothetical protein
MSASHIAILFSSSKTIPFLLWHVGSIALVDLYGEGANDLQIYDGKENRDYLKYMESSEYVT